MDVDGCPISIVGWVRQEPHTDFDEFYVPIQFTESDKMLGWCELIVPEYKELE